MSRKCDLCGNMTKLANYRRRDGDVVCKNCLSEHGCHYWEMIGDGTNQEFNEDGPLHPKYSEKWDGGEA